MFFSSELISVIGKTASKLSSTLKITFFSSINSIFPRNSFPIFMLFSVLFSIIKITSFIIQSGVEAPDVIPTLQQLVIISFKMSLFKSEALSIIIEFSQYFFETSYNLLELELNLSPTIIIQSTSFANCAASRCLRYVASQIVFSETTSSHFSLTNFIAFSKFSYFSVVCDKTQTLSDEISPSSLSSKKNFAL